MGNQRNLDSIGDIRMSTARTAASAFASTESLDLLIPRGRLSALTPEGRVLRTTTIEVTVTPAASLAHECSGNERGDLVLTPVDSVVTASLTAGCRRSSVVLRDLGHLPDFGVNGGHQQQK